MKCNIGKKNRLARLAMGLIAILIAVYLFRQNAVFAGAVAIAGVAIILEAASGYCIVHGLRGTRDMR